MNQDVSIPALVIRLANDDDLPRLDGVRQAAFVPVFESFRSMLGEEIYDLAQAHEDEAQGSYLVSLFGIRIKLECLCR